MNLSTVTQKGQVTIPVYFRNKFGLKVNSRVSFVEKKGEIVIKKEPDLVDLAGTFKPKKNVGVDSLVAREYMETHYERV